MVDKQQKQAAQIALGLNQDDSLLLKRKPRTSDPNFNQEKTNLIVNYLPQNFTDQEFFNLFSTVGKCNKARIIRHRQTGYSYGYGFIDMGSPEDAEKAIKKLNQYQIGHKRLKVAYSLPSGERTRNINLYIKGIPKNWTKRELEASFRRFGDIRNARILLDPSTQTGTGVGFLLFATKVEAEKACEAMNGESLEGGEPLQMSFARSQSQPPLEWVLQSSVLQQAIATPTLTAFPGVAPQATSAYKGRRYNPIVRPGATVAVPTSVTAGQQQRQFVFPNQIQQNGLQQMIMVPTYNPMAQFQPLAAAEQMVQPTTTIPSSTAAQIQSVPATPIATQHQQANVMQQHQQQQHQQQQHQQQQHQQQQQQQHQSQPQQVAQTVATTAAQQQTAQPGQVMLQGQGTAQMMTLPMAQLTNSAQLAAMTGQTSYVTGTGPAPSQSQLTARAYYSTGVM